jgi:hypothetical protein
MKYFSHLQGKLALCLVLILLSSATSAFGQTTRLFIIDPLVMKAVGNISDATATDKIFQLPDNGNPITLIADELKTGTYSEMHLYLLTKPGSMIFDELTILADNVADYALLFAEWKKLLPPGAKIIIHSDTLTSSPDGTLIVNKISEFTGAGVSVQN